MAEEVKNTELDVLLAGSDVEIRGEQVHVKPYNWVTTIKMAKPFRDVVQAILENNERVSVLGSLDQMSGAQQVYAVLDLLAEVDGSNDVVKAVAELITAAIDKDIEYVEGLAIDEIVELGVAVYKVNKDFFAQKLPKIAKLMPAKEDSKNEKSPHTKLSKS